MISFTLASFNIGAAAKMHGRYTKENLNAVANAIKSCGADVVACQEVDLGCERSEKVDMPKYLSESAGYPYLHFIRIRPFQGGLYGTLILSRHRIVSSYTGDFKVVHAKQGTSYGYAVIEIGREEITVFNTHLSIENEECNLETMRCFRDELLSYGKDFVSAGDFNALPVTVGENMKGINLANTELCTYEDRAIDNILFTKGFKVDGIRTVDTVTDGTSDHRMLIANIKKL